MTYQIVIEPRAMQDVRSAALWIEEPSKSPARAMKWVQNIRAEIETLKINPSRHRARQSEAEAFDDG
ncbi:hypothetical protein [Singulisphaera sp. PoT]|uniref:hypothetical protein n=1 Tax=Singulisphaera sp. PoT TaxID=3411797 RepID=UPI003BF4E917